MQVEKENECDEDDDWEYVEEGPAEIIWQGNEIIIRKKKVRVPKKDANPLSKREVILTLLIAMLGLCLLYAGCPFSLVMAKIKLSTLLFPLQDVDRPTSNPLPPQSEAFADHQNAQQALETVAQQVPNFGTEQACLFFQSVYLKFSICNYCIISHFYYICLFIMVNHVFIIYGRIKLIVLSI